MVAAEPTWKLNTLPESSPIRTTARLPPVKGTVAEVGVAELVAVFDGVTEDVTVEAGVTDDDAVSEGVQVGGAVALVVAWEVPVAEGSPPGVSEADADCVMLREALRVAAEVADDDGVIEGVGVGNAGANAMECSSIAEEDVDAMVVHTCATVSYRTTLLAE